MLIGGMVLCAFLCLAMQLPKGWPAETGHNGYDYYLRAAAMAGTGELKGLIDGNSTDVKPGSTPLDVYRQEAKEGTPILELLEQGNALPVRNPRSSESLSTLFPEFASLKRLARLAANVSYAEACDGHMDAASSWLMESQKFAYRFPVDTYIGALVKIACEAILDRSAMFVMPRMTVDQLDTEISLAKEMADNPVNMEKVAKNEVTVFEESVADIVADPAELGLPDGEALDWSKLFESMQKFKSEITKEDLTVLAQIAKKSPNVNPDTPGAFLAALHDGESGLGTKDRARVDRLIRIFSDLFKPEKMSMYELAKSLTVSERTHATNLILAYCAQSYRDLRTAFAEPERRWGLPFNGTPSGDPSTIGDDVFAGSRMVKIDGYALQLADVISTLGDLEVEYGRRPYVLERERRRLFVINAEIERYQLLNHKLPSTLAPLGNPVDPDSGKPYEYKKLSYWSYSLAAVGVPGFDRIDMENPRSSALAKAR